MPPSSHIFYYTGNLQLKLESALSVWQKMFLEKHGELNFSRCNIDDTSPEQLFGELSTPPFLAAKRLTVVRIPAPAKSKEEPWERKKSEKIVPRIFPEYDESEYWKKLIKSIPEDHIVAFVGADYLPGLQKILLETATVKNFSVDSTWDKQDYAQKQLPLITQSHAALLITRVGEDMLLLENEIQKLSLLSTITERDILENTIESIDVKIFSITDAILA